MEQGIILTREDVEFLQHHESGIHLAHELKLILNKSRKEIDSITADGLPVVQGRISAVKEMLTLLGVEYE